MNKLIKYYSSFLSYKIHSIVGGSNISKKTKQKDLFSSIKIKNKNLAKELEAASSSKEVLSFSQFLQISQFGKNGYYSTHKNHGMTDTFVRWPKAIIKICKENRFEKIIEFGCGDGSLGVETMKIAKELNLNTSWTGIEINPQEISKAEALFKKYKIQDTKYGFVNSIEDLKTKKPCLIIFSYSLDSIAPDLFINTSDKQSIPDSTIGVKIKNGLLSEVLLPINTTYKLQPKTYLKSWQRICIPISAYEILKKTIKILPKGSVMLIIDEFSPPPLPWETKDLCMPRDLEKFDPRREVSFEDLYRNSGENLLYFPAFLSGYIMLLKSLDVRNITYDNEHRAAERLMKNKPLTAPESTVLSYAVLAKI